MVSFRRFVVVLLAVVSVLSLLGLGVPAGAKDDVIILRLEDNSGARSGQPAPDKSEPAAPTQQPSVDLPSTSASPVRPPSVTAPSAAIIDADTGQVLFQKNAHARRPNASTTKIMTAILLIENCAMTDTIKVSKKASLTPFTSLNLRPGEKISVKDLLTGMMIRSANDAAVAAAEHVAGSTAGFAALMNKKAREIGCSDTHFVTPNGLYDKSHYSSAYDLCLMARYAFRYPIFNEVVNTRKYFLNSRTINKKDLAVFARAKFLKNYPGADGVKSGYIKQAGQCYVGSATHDGWRLVSAVLSSGNVSGDTATMMDWVYNNFEPVTVARADTACAKAPITGGSTSDVQASPESDVKVIVPKAGARITTRTSFHDLEAPVAKGAAVGTITAFVDGKPACEVKLRAADAVGVSFARRARPWALGAAIILLGLVGKRYGTAFAENSGRRRRRFTAPVRSLNRYR